MNRVTSTITYGNNATIDADDDWRQTARPWTVELRYQRRRMTVNFWTGQLAVEPTTAQVLECLFMDAAALENARDFADWCADYGYNDDSRKAERIYREVQRQTERLRRLLGSDFSDLIWLSGDEIERIAA